MHVRALGGAKAKRVFDTLLLARGAVVSRERLAEVVWGDALPRDVDGSLKAYVTVLRERIQPGAGAEESVVVEEPDGYRFDPSRATSVARDMAAVAG